MADVRAGASRPLAARWFTEVFAPAHLVIGLLPVIGWHSTRSPRGLAWGLLAAVCCGVIPYAHVIAETRRGRLTDRHVTLRGQRLGPLAVTAASVTLGMAVMVAGGAPRELFALAAAMLAGLAVVLAVTTVWKVSVHTAVGAGTVVILALTFGPAWALTALLLVPLAWSRVALGHHTAAQTAVGTLVGGAVAAAVFAGLR